MNDILHLAEVYVISILK